MVEIGKSAAAQGQELAKLYGQRTEAESASELSTRQNTQSRPVGTGEGRAAVMVEISPEARERAEREEALAAAKALYPEVPALRADVVEAVRQRLDAGFYETAAAKEALVERLLPLARRLEAGSL
jgi:hypothetical protein